VDHELKDAIERLTEATLALARVQVTATRTLVELLKDQRQVTPPNFTPRLTHEGADMESRLAAVRGEQG
jgi:hypothetical protein